MGSMISRGQLLELLKQILGTQVEMVDCKAANQQEDYLVLLTSIRRPNLKLVIKLAGPKAWMASDFERAAALNRLVAENTDTPMPETLAYSMSYTPWRYMVRISIPGEEWVSARIKMDTQEQADAYGRIAHAVSQLHQIKFSAFGEISADGSIVGSTDYLAALRIRAARLIRHPILSDLFLNLLEQQKNLFYDVSLSCLCHEDLHGYNVLFYQAKGSWKLATILDFDKAWAGHNEIDLARMELWRGMTGPDYWLTYQKVHPIDPLFEQRKKIYQLLWCFEYAQATPDHIQDTQRLCQELGVQFPGFTDLSDV